MLFIPLINVKMPTIICILTFMSSKKPCSVELRMKNFLLPRAMDIAWVIMSEMDDVMKIKTPLSLPQRE